MKNGKAVYIDTGAWSSKAIKEAKKYGEVIVAASSKDKNYSYIPDCSDLDIPDDADYVYICENETIHGVTWQKLPNTKGHILVSDQSSMFLSQPCNVSDYGMIYAGVQKNVGPAGMVIVIIREDLIREDLDPKMPIYMRYDTHAKNGSMYNTPNCWAIYCCGKVFKYLKSIGGLGGAAQAQHRQGQGHLRLPGFLQDVPRHGRAGVPLSHEHPLRHRLRRAGCRSRRRHQGCWLR